MLCCGLDIRWDRTNIFSPCAKDVGSRRSILWTFRGGGQYVGSAWVISIVPQRL